MMKRLLALATAVFMGALPAHAQTATAKVVSTCATLALPSPTANTPPFFLTVDQTGALCVVGGGASAAFGSAFPANGGPIALDIAGLAQPWFGLTAGGVNYGLVGVVDNTGTQLNGYPVGTFAVPSASTISVVTLDPCSSALPSSVAISVTSATTTSLVATSGTTTVYVCGYSFTIAPSATAADTALIERGTGAACVTTQAALTGTYGNGDLTSAAPVVPIVYGGAGKTVIHSAGTDAICLVTTGTAVNVQGVLTYVQQ